MVRTIRDAGTVILAASALLTAGAASAFTRDPATVFVNELHYDNRGVDLNEAVEIAGPAETDLTGWRLVLYNGSDGRDYFTQELSGITPDQGAGFGAILIGLPTGNFQNGAPDGLALVDADDRVVQLLSYEGAFRASSGPAAGLDSTDIGVSEPGNTAQEHSLQLQGQGTVYQDFTWVGPTASSYRAPNQQQIFLREPGPVTAALPRRRLRRLRPPAGRGTDHRPARRARRPAGADLTRGEDSGRAAADHSHDQRDRS